MGKCEADSVAPTGGEPGDFNSTGVPSADFSCVVSLSVPGAGLLEVVEELDGLDDWFDVQALNTATGAVSRAWCRARWSR